MTNLDSILKSRDITLPTKVHLVKGIVFPVVIYGCESWTIKKAEHQRIDAFELWCWRRLLRVPWTAKRSNQQILKEINSEYSFIRCDLQIFSFSLQFIFSSVSESFKSRSFKTLMFCNFFSLWIVHFLLYLKNLCLSQCHKGFFH